jgi:4-amino-4-deoxy-L-arabinose transferase-like glycosyltransferase
VEHFPTENTRQLEFGPWAAFVSAHVFLLEGTDRLVNLPQWSAMALSILLLSLLVELLGRYCGLPWCSSHDTESCRKRQNAGALAALIGATVPMGMMQALTPQTDYLTTFWVLCCYVFALALFLQPRQPLFVLGIALASSLALLTKSTAVIYAAPLAVWCGGWALTDRAGRAWKLGFAGTIALAVLLLNTPHALRNHTLFGSPLGSRQIHEMVRNERVTPGVFASNFIRNLALHNNCGVPG